MLVVFGVALEFLNQLEHLEVRTLAKKEVLLRGDRLGPNTESLGIESKDCCARAEAVLLVVAKRVEDLGVALLGGGASAVEVRLHSIFCFVDALLGAVKAVEADEIECVRNEGRLYLVV